MVPVKSFMVPIEKLTTVDRDWTRVRLRADAGPQHRSLFVTRNKESSAFSRIPIGPPASLRWGSMPPKPRSSS